MSRWLTDDVAVSVVAAVTQEAMQQTRADAR